MKNNFFIFPGAFDPVEFWSDFKLLLEIKNPSVNFLIVPMPTIIKMALWKSMFYQFCKENEIDFQNSHFFGFSSGGSLAIILSQEIKMLSLHLLAPTVKPVALKERLKIAYLSITKTKPSLAFSLSNKFAHNPIVNKEITSNRKFLNNLKSCKFPDSKECYIINCMNYAKKITCPTFIYHGNYDEQENWEYSYAFFKALSDDIIKEFTLIDQSGNCAHLDKNKEKLIAKITDGINELAAD